MLRPGPRNLITDVPGIRVGNAQDPVLKSGVTVLLGDAPLTAAVSIMGGAPGTREVALLEPDKLVQEVNALVLSGGSAFGLDAASGVADALVRQGIGFAVGPVRVPIVPGAILFDLLNGGDKDWDENPYKKLGAAALAAAGTRFDLGSHGAGTGALIADMKGGLGSASVVLPCGVTVGAVVAVNALGQVTMGDGSQFWAAPFEMDAEFGGLGAGHHNPRALARTKAAAHREATTIAIVATDARLTQAQCKRMATAAHDGMARAIVPSHTPMDGDLVFAAATGARALADPVLDALDLGHAAALCLSRAIARGVYLAQATDTDTAPTWAARFGPDSGQ